MTLYMNGAPARGLRFATGVVLCLGLAACGGGGSKSTVQRGYGGSSAVSQAFATGPISVACMQGGRKAANPRLCGCVQAVANQTLRARADQSLAATFFGDPHQAQVIRQSDNPSHEEFWQRYKVFSGKSEQVCQGL